MDRMNLFDDSYNSVVEDIQNKKCFLLTEDYKNSLKDNVEQLINDGMIEIVHNLQCLECGEDIIGLCLVENNTSNAECLDCLDKDFEFNPDLFSLVYCK